MAASPTGFNLRYGSDGINLHEVIAHREVRADDGSVRQEPENYIDRAVTTYRAWGMDPDVAARLGVDLKVFRGWRRKGSQLAADILEGRKTWRDLTERDRQYIELDHRCTQAEHESRLYLMGLAGKMAKGGIERTRTEVERDARGQEVKRRTITETMLPDAGMIRFILEKRWAREFGRQAVEVTGADGGPIEIEHRHPDIEAFITEMAQMGENLRHEPAPPPGLEPGDDTTDAEVIEDSLGDTFDSIVEHLDDDPPADDATDTP